MQSKLGIRVFFYLSIIFLLYNVVGLLTWYKHIYLLPIMLVLTFATSYYCYIKNSLISNFRLTLLLGFPLPLILLLTCFFVKDFSRGLPYIIFIPISCYLAFLFYRYKKKYIAILSLILFAFIAFVAFPNYFIYYHNHKAERSVVFNKITLLNTKNEKVLLDNDKIIVLDFWTTNCGICFEKFPDLEKTYIKYKNNERVKIISVNVPIRNDKFGNTIKILDSIGYTFPKLYAKSFKEVENNLKFNTFPHLMILKNNIIRYDGYLVTSDESKLYNIDDEINRLLNEK